MLNSDDSATVVSLRLLRRAIGDHAKPVLLWIGAGASIWNNYPSWLELARQMRREFFKVFSPEFNNQAALKLIETNLPAFFQMCKDQDRSIYFRILSNALSAKAPSVLYKRFIKQIELFDPIQIVTTNTDEMLEQSLGPIRVIQKTDLAIAPELLQSRAPFIAKLHGSVSAVETMVFTTHDYDALRSDTRYLAALKSVFSSSLMIFLGYSLRDQYIVDLLQQTAHDQELFGAGPHFIVTGDASWHVPNVHRICYRNERFMDHRAALRILDVIKQSFDIKSVSHVFPEASETRSNTNAETAYYISDFKPQGTWKTEETAEFKGQDGFVGRLTCGLGFSDDELPFRESTAMHDFTVGLICFDRVYLQLISLGALFSVIKEDLFKEIVESDVIRFIHMVNVPAVVYKPDATFGALSMILLGGSGSHTVTIQPGQTIPEISASEMLSRQISPAQGKEREGAEFIEKVAKVVRSFKYEIRQSIGFSLTDSLLMPEVTRLLGISDAILPSQVPLWLKFPYLRMTDLVHTGNICAKFGIQAAKVPFGGSQLISAAFGIQPASEWAERVASYGLSGRFDTNLGEYVIQHPHIIRKILKFRNSAEGQSFRREVGQALLQETGAEFTASVNAGLRTNIPSDVLQRGYDTISLMTESANVTRVPAVWTDALRSDDSTVYWRRRSMRTLLELCRARGISRNEACICGSGEKLRLCCMRPLTS